MSAKIYEMVTERMIKMLEAGVIPWRRPWNNGGSVNWKTQRPYRGINTLLLDPGEYATFKQISEAGGKVKKGEKSKFVVFWKWVEKENEETGKLEKIPFLRFYNVFEINSQCEGLESKRKEESFEHDPIEAAEKIKVGYNGPPIKYAPGKAYYMPSLDMISVPEISDFPKVEEFYSVLFHEMIHSTGHTSRLNRSGVGSAAAAFGSETYSKEELIAEMGAAMLCGVAGIDNSTMENSAAYIASWLRKLKDDTKLVIQAAGQAQKAADLILGTEFAAEND